MANNKEGINKKLSIHIYMDINDKSNAPNITSNYYNYYYKFKVKNFFFFSPSLLL